MERSCDWNCQQLIGWKDSSHFQPLHKSLNNILFCGCWLHGLLVKFHFILPENFLFSVKNTIYFILSQLFLSFWVGLKFARFYYDFKMYIIVVFSIYIKEIFVMKRVVIGINFQDFFFLSLMKFPVKLDCPEHKNFPKLLKLLFLCWQSNWIFTSFKQLIFSLQLQ